MKTLNYNGYKINYDDFCLSYESFDIYKLTLFRNGKQIANILISQEDAKHFS